MKSPQAVVARDFVGYGRDVPRVQWPDANRLAVSVVVNFEEGAERSPVDGDDRSEDRAEIPRPQGLTGRDLAVESYYEYGSRVAIWRILDLLAKHRIHATFFACAQALERHPQAAKAIVEAGHEICSHGYRWIPPGEYTREQEAQDIRRAVASIERTCGQRPLGWYCRYGPTAHTRELLVEHGGFLYDSDSYADDVPYYVNTKNQPFLTVPYSLDVNDIKFWMTPGFVAAEQFSAYAKGAFDLLREESRQVTKMMSIGIHLRIAGRPGRAASIEDMLSYMARRGGAWFAKRCEIARWWMDNVPPQVRDAR
jgi:peptidoglycan/xylan/chitin deacetylase (PgdA/CDA1 family)